MRKSISYIMVKRSLLTILILATIISLTSCKKGGSPDPIPKPPEENEKPVCAACKVITSAAELSALTLAA